MTQQIDLSAIREEYAAINDGLADRQANLVILKDQLTKLVADVSKKNADWKKSVTEFANAKKIGRDLTKFDERKSTAAAVYRIAKAVAASKATEITNAKRELQRFRREANQIARRIGLIATRINKTEEAVYDIDGERIIKSKDIFNGFVICVAAEMGASTNLGCLASLMNARKDLDAEFVISPLRPHLPALWTELPPLDKLLIENYKKYIAHEYTINGKLVIKELHINAQQADPTAGLSRLAQKKRVIVAGAKQHRKGVPVGNNIQPSLIMSMGVMSYPQYRPNRTGELAKHDHCLGGVIIRFVNGVSHECPFQFDEDDSFVNPFNGYRYFPNGKKVFERAEAYIGGDVHEAEKDEAAIKELIRAINIHKPYIIFFHDIFDGASVNPHAAGKDLTSSFMADHVPTLKIEIKRLNTFLVDFKSKIPKDTKIVIVRSNHDRFLDRWIESFDRWMNLPKLPSKLPPNHVDRFLDEATARVEIIKEQVDNVSYMMELFKHKRANPSCNILQYATDPNSELATWLDVNDDYFVEGIQCGAHGDSGPNGARGSVKNHHDAYGKAAIGHTHLLWMYFGAMSCGHLSKIRHGYNNGVQTWEQGFGAIWKGGLRTLFRIDYGTKSSAVGGWKELRAAA